MKTRRKLKIWLLTLTATLFFCGALLANASSVDVPLCISEGNVLLEAEARDQWYLDFDELLAATAGCAVDKGNSPEYSTDAPFPTSFHHTSILRI